MKLLCSILLLLPSLCSAASSSQASAVSAIITADGGPVFSATATNFTYPHTNAGVVYSSNTYSGAVMGRQYNVSLPTNVVSTSYDNFTPEVAGFVAGQTVWVTNGVFRGRYRFIQDGVERGTSFSFKIAAEPVGATTLLSYSNWVSTTLAGACNSNLWVLTNARPSDRLYLTTPASGQLAWAWNTNCYLFGVTGYTGLSQFNSNSGTAGAQAFSKWTLITPRHAYTAGHVPNAGAMCFMGTDGSTNIVWTQDRIYTNSNDDDYCLVLLSNDVPAVVQPVVCAWVTNIQAKIPALTGVSLTAPTPSLETCQHGYAGSQTCTIGSGHTMHVALDSGNPRFIVVSNTIVNYGGTSGSLLSSNFIASLKVDLYERDEVISKLRAEIKSLKSTKKR